MCTMCGKVRRTIRWPLRTSVTWQEVASTWSRQNLNSDDPSHRHSQVAGLHAKLALADAESEASREV